MYDNHMLYITLFTPPVKTGKKVSRRTPHIVEHVVDIPSKVSYNFFFDSIFDNTANIIDSYTKYTYNTNHKPKDLIQKICNPLSKGRYLKEIKAFKEEYKANHQTYVPWLWLRISQYLYGKNFIWDWWDIPSFQECIDYHKTWYKRENIIISNDDDKIIYKGKNIITKTSIGIDEIVYHTIPKDKQKVYCICFSYTSSTQHRLAFFIKELLQEYIRYYQRYEKAIYFYDDVEFILTQKHCVVSFNKKFNKLPTEWFFKEFQKYLIKNVSTTYDGYRKIVDTIYGIKPLSDKAYKTRIASLQHSDIIKIIKKAYK